MNPMLSRKAQAQPQPQFADKGVERGFEKVILRLVKGGPERLAIEAGQVDAVVDPASGSAILLPAAQRALFERQQAFRSLVALSSDWTWEQDEHHRFIPHAGAVQEMPAWASEGILGQPLWTFSVDNPDEADWQTHRQQLEWRVSFRDLEVRHVDRDGKLHYLSLSGEPIFDEHDQFRGYRGIARDITARIRAQARAQESNRSARAALDALSTQVGVLDRAGVVLLANEAWHRFAASHTGLGAGISEGGNFLAACDQTGDGERLDGLAIAAGIRQVIAGEREQFRYEHASGSLVARRWFALSITRHGEDGDARAVVCREDISERKRGELLRDLEYAVARDLADRVGSGAGLKSLIRRVCETQGWRCGRYFHLDPVAGVLRFEESWGVPDAAVERFLENSRDLVFRPGAGLPGRVCKSGQPLWVAGGSQDDGVSPTALAPETGGDAAFVIPVLAQDSTIGVLAFSSTRVAEPDDRMLQAFRSIGSQLGRFLQRQQADETLRRSEARFRRLTEHASDWYWEQDRDFRFTQCVNSSVLSAENVLGKTYWELPNIVLDAAPWAEHKSQLAAKWSFCDFEFAALQADGQLGYFSINGEPVYDEFGTFTGYCGTGLDITRRKRAEIALREREAR